MQQTAGKINLIISALNLAHWIYSFS